MSRTSFDENCPGCKPAMVYARTNKVLPDDHPHMVVVLKLWDKQPRDVKEAWHRVMCKNARTAEDLAKVAGFAELIQQTLGSR